MSKDGKGKKGKKTKVPKEIGGVKVPKKLRKLGNKAVKAAKDPAVTEVVAGALLAAAAALREGKDPKTAVGAAVKSGFKSAASSGGSRLSDSLKLLAVDFAQRTLDGMGEKKERNDAAPAPAAGAGEVRAEPAPEPRPTRTAKAPAEG